LCSEREETDHSVPGLSPELQKILEEILEEGKEVFEALARP